VFRSTGEPQHEIGAWGRERLQVDGKLDKFQLQNHPKKKTPLLFPRQRAFFIQFLLLPLTLLFIGGRFLPFAIYSQTDSPQECQSNEKYYETNAHAGTL
jgi:hypothetical protein